MLKILTVLINLIMFVTISITIYMLIRISREKRVVEKINKNFDILSHNYKKRVKKLKYSKYYINTKKKNNLIQELDILIQKTNIGLTMPYITTEVIIAFSLILAFIAGYFTFMVLYNILAAIILASFVFLFPMNVLKIIAHMNALKVDNQLVYYINILKNFCYIQDNIVFSIERAIPYLKEPLKTFSFEFVNEVKHGITPYVALEHYKNKVQNKRFNLLIKNLQLCVKYKGSYVEVLNKSKNIMKDYSIERNRRKTEVQKTRSAIYTLIGLCILIFVGLTRMNPDLILDLKKDIVGQIIVCYNIFAIIFGVYKSLTLERFEY